MEYQFIEYVESIGKDITGMSAGEIEAIRSSFLNGKITLVSNIPALFLNTRKF